jgi:hypothetical protein
MKPFLPILSAIASFGLLAFSRPALGDELLVSAVFDQSDDGGGAPVSTIPAGEGRRWEGTAVVGQGLMHGGDDTNSHAFVPIEVPQGAKKLVVEIGIVSRTGGQFGFGFLNGTKILEKNGPASGNNQGVIWVNHAGPTFKFHAGPYANGVAPDSANMQKWADGIEIEIRFEAAVVDEGGYRCSVSVGGKEVVAGDLLPEIPAEFRHFFIQFRGGEGTRCGTSVHKVSVRAE